MGNLALGTEVIFILTGPGLIKIGILGGTPSTMVARVLRFSEVNHPMVIGSMSPITPPIIPGIYTWYGIYAYSALQNGLLVLGFESPDPKGFIP